MQPDHQTHRPEIPASGDRRAFIRLMAGASLAFATALAGCSNMQAQPRGARPKTYIRGNGGRNGKSRG